MAKNKETSVPLIFALVFFVLTTVAFGVMWYLSFSEIEGHVNAKKNAEKDVSTMRASKDEAERLARLYRIYLGVPRTATDDNDINTINAESKAGDKIAAELKLLNDSLAAKMSTTVDREEKEAKAFLDELDKKSADELKDYIKKNTTGESLVKLLAVWPVDANGKAAAAPAEGLIDQFARFKSRDAAYAAAEEERKSYQAQVGNMVAAAAALKVETDKFQKEIAALPKQVQDKINGVIEGFKTRTAQYVQAENTSNAALKEARDKRDEYERELRKVRAERDAAVLENQRLVIEKAAGERKSISFDEPQGKVLAKRPDGVIEINIGSADNAFPGLTFSVMPSDYPSKGPRSRLIPYYAKDGRGGYALKTPDFPVPRASIEVYEVVNERLSLARIVPGTEINPIRDGLSQGDLLYNSGWRKGVADHIALAGIFDINGDGIDDIESVVRDLNKIGIPVDAYYDMKKRAWVGQVTERTTLIIEGLSIINSATDPNRDEKTKLIDALTKAIDEGRRKGVNTMKYRDYFSRIGYRYKLDVSDDRINQATAPYLSNVGLGDPVPAPPPP
jgi:hypothetical protein